MLLGLKRANTGFTQATYGGTSRTCGLYYKPITTINDDSSVITKLETSVTDNARVVIYNSHMFIVQATEIL